MQLRGADPGPVVRPANATPEHSASPTVSQSLLARRTDAHGRNDFKLKQERLGLAQRHGDGFDEYRPEHSSAFENRDIVIEAEYIDNSENSFSHSGSRVIRSGSRAARGLSPGAANSRRMPESVAVTSSWAGGASCPAVRCSVVDRGDPGAERSDGVSPLTSFASGVGRCRPRADHAQTVEPTVQRVARLEDCLGIRVGRALCTAAASSVPLISRSIAVPAI